MSGSWRLSWDADGDTDDMFALRIGLARLGVYREFVNWIKLDTERSVRLLEAAISSWDEDVLRGAASSQRHDSPRIEAGQADETAAFTRAVQTNPVNALGIISSTYWPSCPSE